MEILNHFETIQFLEVFLTGLLEVGLLEPLQKLSESELSNVKRAAHSLYNEMVGGKVPQVAISLMVPRFSPIVEALIINGFEQSNVDMVLSDIIKIYKGAKEELDEALQKLLDHYSPLKTDALCIECSANEIQKLYDRALVENAKEVIVSYQSGHLVQKYIAAKLVTVTEPAIPAVYRTLRKTLMELKTLSGKKALDIEIQIHSDNSFQTTFKNQSLIISFAD
ncbi:MAG: hypothetical protein ACXVCP_15610 [Bdellovibrio sp.]